MVRDDFLAARESVAGRTCGDYGRLEEVTIGKLRMLSNAVIAKEAIEDYSRDAQKSIRTLPFWSLPATQINYSRPIRKVSPHRGWAYV